jgi:general secretion pathway protein K
VDEERKININEAPEGLLIALLEACGVSISEAPIIAKNIIAWRGNNVPCNNTLYQDLGYTCKREKFTNVEELILVAGITAEIYQKIKPWVTVWGSDKVNINTASGEVIGILVEYCRQKNISDDLVNRITRLHTNNIVIDDLYKLENVLDNLQRLTTDQKNIISELLKIIDVKSSCFYIRSNGKIKDSPFYEIDCIFNRNSKKIIYWHER